DGRVALGIDPADLTPIAFSRTGWIELSGRFPAERATTMAVVAQALQHAGDTRPRVLLAGPRSTLGKTGLWDTAVTTKEELLPLLESGKEAPIALFVETSTLTTADAGFVDIIVSGPEFAQVQPSDSLFVIEMDTDRAAVRSYSRHLRGDRCGILLSPRSLDLTTFGASPPSTPPEGTVVLAYWVEEGTPRALLLPLRESGPVPVPGARPVAVDDASSWDDAFLPSPGTGSLLADEPVPADESFDRTIAPRLVVSTGERYPLVRRIIVGRRPRAQSDDEGPEPLLVTVPSPQQDIARSHVELLNTRSGMQVRDLHTTNGTRLIRPGRIPTRIPSDAPIALRPDDVIDLGDEVRLSFEDCELLWRRSEGSDLDGDVAADAPTEA
ncbi:MAG: FHA domain-containing protein, partial [Microbacterium sp.]